MNNEERREQLRKRFKRVEQVRYENRKRVQEERKKEFNAMLKRSDPK